MWNEEKDVSVFDFLSHMAEVNQVLPSKQDASKFFSCSNDKTVKVFDISTAAALHSFNDHEWG